MRRRSLCSRFWYPAPQVASSEKGLSGLQALVSCVRLAHLLMGCSNAGTSQFRDNPYTLTATRDQATTANT